MGRTVPIFYDRNRIKDGWEKLHKQTNRRTNRHYENNGHLAVNESEGSSDVGRILCWLWGSYILSCWSRWKWTFSSCKHYTQYVVPSICLLAHQSSLIRNLLVVLWQKTLLSVPWHCWFGARKSIRSLKDWVVRCWRGYLSGARRKWFAYGPADATVTPSSLASLKSTLT